VVDLGCGAGCDSLIAALHVGPSGSVTAVDLAPEMVHLTRQNARAADLATIDVHQAAVEALPLPSASADLIMANGVFNLAAETDRALAEAFRVLKPGGALIAAEIVLTLDIPRSERATLDDWFR
jgi:ubiquinone/menaquinone biosynthesis C-methylase UbiE